MKIRQVVFLRVERFFYDDSSATHNIFFLISTFEEEKIIIQNEFGARKNITFLENKKKISDLVFFSSRIFLESSKVETFDKALISQILLKILSKKKVVTIGQQQCGGDRIKIQQSIKKYDQPPTFASNSAHAR